MKLGQVLAKERRNRALSESEVAKQLGLSDGEYTAIEAGESEAELWGPRLAAIAVALGVPTSRLISTTGRAEDAEPCGPLIRAHREQRGTGVSELAAKLNVDRETYQAIEAGTSELEKYAPMFLRFSELVRQPVFNLFYPCGLPFWELEDYP